MKTKDLNQRIARLEYIVKETLWMARRYADGRRTYAPGMVNLAIQSAHELGLRIDDDPAMGGTGRYARDPSFGEWDESTGNFVTLPAGNNTENLNSKESIS